MFTERKPLGLKIIAALAVINSVAALVHFILLAKGFLKVLGLIEVFWVFATAISLAGILPVLLGSYGLYQRRTWGLGLFTFGSGAYLCGSLLLFLLSVREGMFGIMFFISIYLILFTLVANLYTWMFRHRFSDF